jgi:hypothetical protein
VKNVGTKAVFFLLSLFSLYGNDQVEILFGSSGYVLYKVLDFANDHGFRYLKILSYEFKAGDHLIQGSCQSDPNQGEFFELEDTYGTVTFLCFKSSPIGDTAIIDLEKYRSILEALDHD